MWDCQVCLATKEINARGLIMTFVVISLTASITVKVGSVPSAVSFASVFVQIAITSTALILKPFICAGMHYDALYINYV